MTAPDSRPTANPLYDLAELGAVFEEFRPRLVAIVRRRLDPALGARLSADDVLHEAFLDAARRWPAYRAAGTPVSPFVWLYGLVRDRLVEEYRKATRARRDARRDLPWPEETSRQLALSLARSSGTPGRAVAGAELARLVRDAVERLPEADREIVRMHDFDGLTFAQIGELLGRKENSVNVRYIRAVRRLREALGEHLREGRG
jgi:RNA polymerase sigma-70 factor (ECF subfamily)